MKAVMSGHEVIVKLFLTRDGVLADSRDNDGRTPLSWAAEAGHLTIIRLLLSRDDVTADSQDSRGRTPLWFITHRGYTGKGAERGGIEAVVRLLEQKMKDLKAWDHFETPWMIDARKQRKEQMRKRERSRECLRQAIPRKAVILDGSPNRAYWDSISDKTATADVCVSNSCLSTFKTQF